MFSDNIPDENVSRTTGGQESSLSSPISVAAVATVGAGLLILLGLALQVAELAYGHLIRENPWIISVTVQAIWNMLTELLGSLALPDMMRFWPLLLVLAGCSILAVLNRRSPIQAVCEAQRREESRG